MTEDDLGGRIKEVRDEMWGYREERSSWEHKVTVSLLSNRKQKSPYCGAVVGMPLAGVAL